MKSGAPDKVSLLSTIKSLCAKGIRQPITIEQVKSWQKQFETDEEKFLGLLILRYLIYRTNKQIDSSLKQALKAAAKHFHPELKTNPDIDWRDVLNGKVNHLEFIFGPPKQSASRPGKSGEIICRQLRSCDSSISFNLKYFHDISELSTNQRYLVIDDGTFTGNQLTEFLSNEGQHLTRDGNCGVVVAFAHTEALNELKNKHPNVPVFFGEHITEDECFENQCKNWINDGIWPYEDVSPFDIYMSAVKKAKFSDNLPLGYGNLGCMVAYEHGIPDNSIQLLWDQSNNWNPLIQR